MKKIVKIFLICIIELYMFSSIVLASTNTTPRTESNLQINDRIKVTSLNKPLILKTPKVNELEKIYDFANLFTDEQENKLYESVSKYIENYNFDMVILTINTNNKSNAMNYADDFYDYNYFGKGSTCNGILFLIDMDTREMWISTTGECIRVYNDDRIDYMLDKAYNYISSQKYYECANSFITEANKYASKGVPSNNQNTYIDKNGDYHVKNKPEELTISEIIISSLVISGIITAIIIVIQLFKHRTIKKGTNANAYFDNSEFKITKREDVFIGTHTDRIYDPPSDSGGSFGGGGSSTHSGSSGISHGGGGRSF